MSTLEIEHTLEAEEALSKSLRDYVGQWVAVVDATVVASASTLGELLEQVEGREDVELLEVPEGDCTVSFF
jgi:hypothetical protein